MGGLCASISLSLEPPLAGTDETQGRGAEALLPKLFDSPGMRLAQLCGADVLWECKGSWDAGGQQGNLSWDPGDNFDRPV